MADIKRKLFFQERDCSISFHEINFLKEERLGLSGVGHVLSSAGLFFLLFLIPQSFNPLTSYIQMMMSNTPLLLICFLTVCGGALLPDLDNSKSDGGSTAGWDLGLFGSALTAAMITISSIMTSVFHSKRDVKPNTQHRFFWHTLLVPLTIILLNYFFTPESNNKVLPLYQSLDIMNFPTSQTIILVMVFICVYIGSYLLLKKASKLIPIKSWPIAIILGLVSVGVIMFTLDESQLKLVGYCVGIGYLFHLFGDMFADSGIPLFPIYTGMWWRRFCFLGPFSVKTGGTIESMLKIVFLSIDIVLLCLIFFPNLIRL